MLIEDSNDSYFLFVTYSAIGLSLLLLSGGPIVGLLLINKVKRLLERKE